MHLLKAERSNPADLVNSAADFIDRPPLRGDLSGADEEEVNRG